MNVAKNPPTAQYSQLEVDLEATSGTYPEVVPQGRSKFESYPEVTTQSQEQEKYLMGGPGDFENFQPASRKIWKNKWLWLGLLVLVVVIGTVVGGVVGGTHKKSSNM